LKLPFTINMAEPITLQLLSETKLDPKPHGSLLTYNPSIELFARAAGPKTLEVWRSNAQSVVRSSQRGEKESVEALRWKTDGTHLAYCARSSTNPQQASSWRWDGVTALCG
jgi:anaphase-promoting complex subunit 4